MKDKSILISMGIILYIIMAGVDRFVYRIPNIVYIPVAILGIREKSSMEKRKLRTF